MWTPFSEEDIDEDREEEPRELPEVKLDATGDCCICGRPGCRNGCFKCGKPACYHPTNYLADSPTGFGGWILDTWHPDAHDGNEYWCDACLKAGLEPETSKLEAAS